MIPLESQMSSVSQKIGLTEITVIYHSPGAKGREIFGKLIPYDRIWRAGANENTKVYFSKSVIVEGKTLPAGTYGLQMIPRQEEWTIIFSNDIQNWGSFYYDEKNDALRISVKPLARQENREWLNYQFLEKEALQTTLVMEWNNLQVPIKISIDRETILADFRLQLKNSAAFSWEGQYAAAQYCLENEFNYDEALQWIEASIKGRPNYQNLKTKAELIEKKGNLEESKKVLNDAIDLASASELLSYTMELIAGGSPEKATKVAAMSIKKYPSDWKSYYASGLVFKAQDKATKALELFNHALSLASDGNKTFVQRQIDKMK